MKPETRFRKNKIDPFLKSLPNCYFEAVQQRGKVGTPDYFFIINGQGGALEIKSSGGKLSKLQEFQLRRVAKAYGWAYVVTPENWEAVKEVLGGLSQQEGFRRRIDDHAYL